MPLQRLCLSAFERRGSNDDTVSISSFTSCGDSISTTCSLTRTSVHPLAKLADDCDRKTRRPRRARLSKQAFKVHSSRKLLECDNSVKSQTDQTELKKLQAELDKARSDADKYKSRWKCLSEENSLLEKELGEVRMEQREQKSHIKELHQENERLKKEIIEKEAESIHISHLVERVQRLSMSSSPENVSPSTTVPSHGAEVDLDKLEEMNLALENEQLRLQNVRLKKEMDKMRATTSAQSKIMQSKVFTQMASMLAPPGQIPDSIREKLSVEDYLWEDKKF